MFIKEHVNKINTPTWVKVNEDAQKIVHRKMFIEKNGGKFIKSGLYVKWIDEEDYHDPGDVYIVKTPEGKIELIEIFSKFCKSNNLNKAAMYGTLNGTRNHHKGYKLIKTPN